MSRLYIQRLRAIQKELNAARGALDYVLQNWQSQSISGGADRFKPGDYTEALGNAEATYFVRLYAEFEGILKDHFATNHPLVTVSDKPKIDWLISRVTQVENLSIELPLRRKMERIRDYRNSIAHRSRRAVLRIPLIDALSTLNTFVAKLPEPLF